MSIILEEQMLKINRNYTNLNRHILAGILPEYYSHPIPRMTATFEEADWTEHELEILERERKDLESLLPSY